MSRRNRRDGGSSNDEQQEMDLKLNLSAGERARRAGVGAGIRIGRHRMSALSEESQSQSESPPWSCVSSEESLKYSSSPEATSMVLVGCPRCLMYVMLSEADPRCPKCKSTVLLDFLRANSTTPTQKYTSI